MNPTIGTEAVVYSSDRPIFGYKVIKVTPSGQVTVSKDDGHTMRFNADGMQMGTSFNRYYTTIRYNVEEVRERIVQEKRRGAAANAIMAVRVERSLATYSPESLRAQIEQLEALLATAKAAVETI